MEKMYKVSGTKEALLQTPVALLFFTRERTLRRTFEQIRTARPAKLFLIQDGPRKAAPEDVNHVARCREIVNDIDWNCDVFLDYSEENMGCALRPYSGFSWVFQHVDRAIILEDDCLPNQSFFKYCDELLEKYKDDQRINLITGYCFFDCYGGTDNSYFFGKSGTNWGWATWKREWDLVEYDLSAINRNQYAQKLFSGLNSFWVTQKKMKEIKSVPGLVSQKRWTTWDVQMGLVKDLYCKVAIIPKYNMIDNIGIGDDSAHFADYSKLSHDDKKLFKRNQFEIKFPMTHPQYMIPDKSYDKYVEHIVYANPVRKLIRKADVLMKKLMLGHLQRFLKT